MPKEFKGIEILRFACALAIVLWHYQHFFLLTDVRAPHIPEWDKERQPLYWLFWLPYNYGSYGVNAFWTISGFIFFWKYADAVTSRHVKFRTFFVLRFSRLYPLHITTLFLVLFLQMLHFRSHGFYVIYPGIDLYHFVLNVFMASGWGLDREFSFNAPIWSVSAEEIIYVLFFVAAFTFRQRILLSLVVALGFYLASKVAPRVGVGPIVPLLSCGVYFFIGGAIQRSFAELKMKPASFLNKFGMIPETLGNLTYSSYLLHFPLMLIFVMVTDRLGLSREVYYDWRLWAGYIASVFLLSHISFVYLERPSRDAIRAMLLGRRASNAA